MPDPTTGTAPTLPPGGSPRFPSRPASGPAIVDLPAIVRCLCLVVCALWVGTPPALGSALCTRCFAEYRAPGGTDSGAVGRYRLDGCPSCQPEDCATAAERAGGLRDRYTARRARYERLNGEIAALTAGGAAIPDSLLTEQARLNFELGQLELQYRILDAACPEQVPGNDVWDGRYDAPVSDSPVAAPDSESHSAAHAAAEYDRVAREELRRLEIFVGFLNTPADGFAPPATGYNGERARVAKGYRALADAYRNEAGVPQGDALRDTPAGDESSLVVPEFAETRIPRTGEAYVQKEGIAARARLEANVYLACHLEARRRLRRARAAGNEAAVKAQGQSVVQTASQALGYARWAADHQRLADVAHQPLLERSLADAAGRGLPLARLLERFQEEVGRSGVPASLREALDAAGASAEELAEAKRRLLALTPEAVEAALQERRARAAAAAEAPDAVFLETQLTVHRRRLHTPDAR